MISPRHARRQCRQVDTQASTRHIRSTRRQVSLRTSDASIPCLDPFSDMQYHRGLLEYAPRLSEWYNLTECDCQVFMAGN